MSAAPKKGELKIKNNLFSIRASYGYRFAKDFCREILEFDDDQLSLYYKWEAGKILPTLDYALYVAKKLNKNVNDIWYIEE